MAPHVDNSSEATAAEMTPEDAAVVAELQRRADLLNNNADARISVNVLRIHGLRAVKDDLVHEYFEQALTATSLGKLIEALATASARMERLDLFEATPDIQIEKPVDFLAGPNTVDVNVFVKEKGRLHAEAGTFMGTHENGMRAVVGIRNVLGRGEKIDTQVSMGTSSKPSFAAHFHKPINGNPDTPIDVMLFHNFQDWTFPSGYEETAMGAMFKYRMLSDMGEHILSYEASWRELSKMPRYVSWPYVITDLIDRVREQAGHSLKSSIKHEWVINRSDNVSLPTRGFQFRLVQELAGLGGDVNFFKHELHTKLGVPLPWGMSTSLGFQGGVIVPLADVPTRINDRFFLGGPTSVRGFRQRALGPQSPRHMDQKPPAGYRSDALGGEAFWAAGLSLFAPVPIPTLWNQNFLKLHSFVNTGNLVRLHNDKPWTDGLRSVLSAADVTAGLGLALQMQSIRLELNYCWLLHGQYADRRDNGVQLGVGLSFL